MDERLKVVWYYAPRAAKRCDEDIEYVHQLRVATRRARAALHIFAAVLPKRRRQWIKKRLRELRRAAGAARDLDVFGERLSSSVAHGQSSLNSVVKKVNARRRKAQKPLIAAYEKAKRDGFKDRSHALAESVRWDGEGPEPRIAKAARTTLAPLVDEFFTAAEADLSKVEALHRMRIAGKQVRYAMELLAGAFDDTFRGELYGTFQGVQEKLGTINDHATAVSMLKQWFERVDYDGCRHELAGLIVNEEKQLDETQREFCSWWTTERATELRGKFASVLGTSGSPKENRCLIV